MLSEHLLDRQGIALNGVILISSILNFETARFDSGNDLPYALYLPTYTATARKLLPVTSPVWRSACAFTAFSSWRLSMWLCPRS